MAENLGNLRNLNAQLAHADTIEHRAVVLAIHPLLHPDVFQPVAGIKRQLICPVKQITVGVTLGYADYIAGGALIMVLASFDEAPVPVSARAVAEGKGLIQQQCAIFVTMPNGFAGKQALRRRAARFNDAEGMRMTGEKYFRQENRRLLGETVRRQFTCAGSHAKQQRHVPR